MTSPRERAQFQLALRQQQEALVRDLLPVLDALDRAESHWRPLQPDPGRAAPRGFWSRFWRWRSARALRISQPPQAADALARSAGEGIGLIRAQLLEALQAHGLEPFESLGQPFDPQRMQALGQRSASVGLPPGQVVEEAVRGYQWQGKLLREAQVLVAGP
jgi:molecular chaperone GrpE (heat shock protein)